MRAKHALVMAGFVCAEASAQPTAVTVRDPGEKSARMVRTDVPPVIDGVLDDPVWQNAA